nr:immunoglobulin heavy chain junction region [Mus musculus]MBK4187564.1 immunoglobulin heavy chain junction region [Mus musculus]MBK4187565.1 immunoglobulin heavy chain junction region [Mus musculus]MBK4187566.1 immunoglobulin heavy chain junction region [Mus musculus]MBK4187570.1 immunoglobulin heavy chain junction region [Mus musculus]
CAREGAAQAGFAYW